MRKKYLILVICFLFIFGGVDALSLNQIKEGIFSGIFSNFFSRFFGSSTICLRANGNCWNAPGHTCCSGYYCASKACGGPTVFYDCCKSGSVITTTRPGVTTTMSLVTTTRSGVTTTIISSKCVGANINCWNADWHRCCSPYTCVSKGCGTYDCCKIISTTTRPVVTTTTVPVVTTTTIRTTSGTCTDTDGGLDYYNAGHIDYRTASGSWYAISFDYCDGSTLTERVCVTQVPSDQNSVRYNCPYGCSYGKCNTGT